MALAVAASGPARLVRACWWIAAAVALAVLPFESRFVLGDYLGVTMTPLHYVAAAAIVAWGLVLAVERRFPSVPLPVLVALGIGLVGGLLSAATGRGFNDEALRFTGISAAAWLGFLSLVDMVRTERDAARMSAVLVGSFVVAAVVGVCLWLLPPSYSVELVGQDHTVAGARRLQATLGYPNTAAVAFSVCAFLAVGLTGAFRGRPARLLFGIALVVLLLATALTLSRGALIGLLAGSATLIGLALVSNRRRFALRGAVAAAGALALMLVVQLAMVPIERLWTDSESDFYRATYDSPEQILLTEDSETLRIPVAVTNAGGSAWHAGQYSLGYHWLDPVSHAIDSFGNLGIALGDVPVGSAVTVTSEVAPLDGESRLLAWDIYQQGGEWFSERGVPVAISLVTPSLRLGDPGEQQTLLLYPALLPEPSRAQLWGAALAMLREAPILGVGPGTFRLRYGPYLGWQVWDERIHANNVYLELAATTGLIGIASFLIVTIYAIGRQLRGALGHSDAESRWLLTAGIAAAAVCFAAHGLVDYFLGFNGTLGLYWAILGIGLGLALGRRTGSPVSALGNDTPR